MKHGLPGFENKLGEIVSHCYAFEMSSFNFIPVGDSAFSYIVENIKHERRYLKVFDTDTRKGDFGVRRLHRYLPLMVELAESSLFPELPRPYSTTRGDLRCNFTHYTCALFEYIDGETLADAYPFSDEIQRKIAGQLAKLHTVPLARLQSDVVRETYDVDFGESLHADLEFLESNTSDDPFVRKLQSMVLPKRERINRFWKQLCEYQTTALQSEVEVVLCHGDIWGGNMIDSPGGQLVFLDWEGAVIAPKERDLFSYIGPAYMNFRHTYAEARQIRLSLNPNLIGFYAYRQQLMNLTQWVHNLLHENYEDEQKQNDLEMIGYHCLDRWPSIESTVMGLQNE